MPFLLEVRAERGGYGSGYGRKDLGLLTTSAGWAMMGGIQTLLH